MVRFLSLGLLAGLASAIPTIEVKGSKLFTSDGDQFFVKGTSIPHPLSKANCEELDYGQGD
jgi:hypothetical protein